MFSFLATAFTAILYDPLFNLLVLVYNWLPGHDFGLAVILLTIIIRVLIYPVSVKALHSQKVLQKLQPKLQEIQRQHKDDKEKQARETLELYRREKINPFSGLFLALVQLPILIALYSVFRSGFQPEQLGHLYHFLDNPGHINPTFLGLIDLSQPSLWFALIAGVVQFFQTKMLLPPAGGDKPKEKDPALAMQKQMVYLFPFITALILFKLPAALGLYWTASGVFSIVQQHFIFNGKKNHG